MDRTWTRESVAQLVDHTLLKPEATAADVEALVAEAVEHGVFAVCVSPSMVPVAAQAAPAGLTVAPPLVLSPRRHLSRSPGASSWGLRRRAGRCWPLCRAGPAAIAKPNP